MAETMTDTRRQSRTGEHNAREVTESEEEQKGSSGVNIGHSERLWSVIGGGALMALGLSAGLKRRSPLGIGLAALGSGMLYRGTTGHCHVYAAMHVDTAETEQFHGLKVDRVVTINKSPAELFAYWRNFENLPLIMEHLKSVKVQSQNRSHWVAKAPAGRTVAWDAEIIDEKENAFIVWQSLPGADVESVGSVWFAEGPQGRGTEVRVSLEYRPPAGMIGVALAKIWGEEPSIQIDKDLLRFKQFMETGEIATTEGQPTGRNQRK